MRTTLTIDDDVANLLNKETKRAGLSFKEAVNHYLRLGLSAAKNPVRKPFVVEPLALNLPPFDSAEELIELLEGPEHR